MIDKNIVKQIKIRLEANKYIQQNVDELEKINWESQYMIYCILRDNGQHILHTIDMLAKEFSISENSVRKVKRRKPTKEEVDLGKKMALDYLSGEYCHYELQKEADEIEINEGLVDTLIKLSTLDRRLEDFCADRGERVPHHLR